MAHQGGSAYAAFRPFDYAVYSVYDAAANSLDTTQIPTGIYTVDITIEVRPDGLAADQAYNILTDIFTYNTSDDVEQVNDFIILNRYVIDEPSVRGGSNDQRIQAYFTKTFAIPEGRYGRFNTVTWDQDRLTSAHANTKTGGVNSADADIDTYYLITRVG